MRVLDHAPASWFLLEEGQRLYLDVNCNHHIVGHTVLIPLDSEELGRFRSEGRLFLDELSADIQQSGAGVLPTSPYTARDLTRTLGEDVMRAVEEWRTSFAHLPPAPSPRPVVPPQSRLRKFWISLFG
ncbi:hypothetical protein [Brevundimonas sp. M20]|uniref:hypothetical protein n=1 Tax=Brevundimonas sp. M20 TaxID=2591463 RepID=UPI001146A537|nr:hypothetical protein [Brevundimonas sp. M20]QDH73059.1 hypothetical protein FKQ52_06250 [Brevundimonas sp. M20]